MTTIQTKDIDCAAYVAFVCNILPDTLRDTFDGQAIFEFERRPEIETAILAFNYDPARQMLAVRRRLFHNVRRLRERG